MDSTWFYILVAAVSSVVVWKGSSLLESSSRLLSAYYRLPAAVHGAIVVAVGSSFPELSSAVLSTLIHGEFELGLSAVVGSAIFNILVIPALSALAAKNKLQTEKLMVYKDAQFYMVSVAVLLIAFSLSIIYYPQGEDPIQGTFTPAIAAIPLVLYGLYIFIQQQETSDYRKENKVEVSDINVAKNWGLLLLGLALVLVSVEGLVRASLFFGEEFDIPPFFWGITVLAIVTSVPDALVSIKLARSGKGVASLSNVLGSNVFDLLVAIPLGVILAGGTVINFSAAIPLMGMLTLATIVLFAALRTRLRLSNREAWLLLFLYVVMIAWLVGESFGWVDLLRGV